MKEYTIAFVGNPNVGKSAWINALSDADFKVGNWPGVTVERKEATIKYHGNLYHLIDLPGCYSLNKQENEERITSDFLQKEQVDLIVNVVDASNLSHNLYLTLLLRELQIPMLIIFNFMDVVEKCAIHIDHTRISKRLQIPILCVSAFRKKDKQLVWDAICTQIHQDGFYYPLLSNEDVEIYVHVYNYLDDHLPSYVTWNEQHRHVFTLQVLKQEETAWKQLEGWQIDLEAIKALSQGMNKERIEKSRYHVIASLMNYVEEDEQKRFAFTRKIDRILLHKYFGLPLFFVIFTFLLLFVFQFSAPYNALIDFLINDILKKYLAHAILSFPIAFQHLLLDGILAGVGGVLTFVPLMAILYMVLSILEESGYMSRIAFLLDRMMHTFHLSGKSFVSLLLGFGCNVPAIYATRTLENEHQKRLTAVLVPFMSCGARLPVYVLFASAFFPHKASLMILSVYGIGILIALILAFLLSKQEAFKEDGLFVLELPNYHMPNFHVVFHKVKEEVKNYVKKAFGIVLWAMVILWGISYFPTGNLSESYMATFAKTAAPIFEPAGFGNRWECVASLPGGIIAKETIVGYFGTVLEGDKDAKPAPIDLEKDIQSIKEETLHAIKSSIHDTFFPNVKLKSQDQGAVIAVKNLWQDKYANLRAFCFMVYVLLSIPCIMTLQALYHEYGKKMLALSIAMMIIIPYGVAVFLFQFFSFLL